MRKKVLILLSLVIILAITSGVYWYFNIYRKPVEQIPEQPAEKLEAKKLLEEWLPNVLKSEFLPSELNIELGVDIGGGVTRDKNTYGYNWHYLGKDFYIALDYNNEKPGINAYVLAVFWDEKIDLNQEIVWELLENYFNLPKFDLKCEIIEIEGKVINSCQGSWKDEEKNWHSLSVISGRQEKREYTFLMYHLTPLGSETYGKELF